MGTNSAPLVADLFLLCYKKDFMVFLSDNKQADIINALNTTSIFVDDILNINNVYFDNRVSQKFPSELQLNKTKASDTKAAFSDLHMSIFDDIFSSKMYDNRDEFGFEIFNFSFLMVMFLTLHHMESLSFNSFVLLEHLAMLLSSALAISC